MTILFSESDRVTHFQLNCGSETITFTQIDLQKQLFHIKATHGRNWLGAPQIKIHSAFWFPLMEVDLWSWFQEEMSVFTFPQETQRWLKRTIDIFLPSQLHVLANTIDFLHQSLSKDTWSVKKGILEFVASWFPGNKVAGRLPAWLCLSPEVIRAQFSAGDPILQLQCNSFLANWFQWCPLYKIATFQKCETDAGIAAKVGHSSAFISWVSLSAARQLNDEMRPPLNPCFQFPSQLHFNFSRRDDFLFWKSRGEQTGKTTADQWLHRVSEICLQLEYRLRASFWGGLSGGHEMTSYLQPNGSI